LVFRVVRDELFRALAELFRGLLFVLFVLFVLFAPAAWPVRDLVLVAMNPSMDWGTKSGYPVRV
jgi:hypothetical protein